MKVKKLIVKGFMPFREQQEITFHENTMTLIFGENGAGKTSLLDAICVCLYGRTFRTSPDAERGFLELSDLVNHDSSEASMHLEFENHGHNYVVKKSIGRTKSGGELLEDGEIKAEDDEVFEYVTRKAIGLDWEGFRRSAVILQGEMSSLTDVLPSTRKEAFVNLFGLAKYDGYRKAISGEIEQKNVVSREMEVANELLANETAKIPQVESSMKRLKKTVADLEQRVSSSARRLRQVKNLTKRLEKDHSRYLAINGAIENIATKMKNLEKTLEGSRDEFNELGGLKKEFRMLERSYLELEGLTRTLKDAGKRKNAYDKLAARIASLRNSLREKQSRLAEAQSELEASKEALAGLKREVPSRQKVAGMRKEIAQLRRRKNELERRKLRLEALLGTTGDAIDSLRRKMGAVKRKKACPVCMQKIASPRSVLRRYLAEINTLLATRRKGQRELDGVTMRLRKIGRSLGNLEITATKMESGLGRYNELTGEQKRFDQLRARRDGARRELESVKQELKSYARQLKSLRFTPREYEAMERHVSALRHERVAEQYSSARIQLRRLPDIAGHMEKARKTLASLRDQRAKLLGQMRRLGDIERRYTSVKQELESAQNAHHQNVLNLTKEKTNYDTLAKQLSELRNKEKRLRQNENKIEDLREKISSLEELVKIFADIPQNILRRLLPYIEKEGTTLINDLSDGTITALNIDRDSLGVGATMAGEVRPIQYFSGGQQVRINMALRVAISRILSRFPQTDGASGMMHTLIIDEGDFGTLDEPGVRDAMSVLQKLTKEFSRIILLSHMESVRENFRGYTVELIKTGPSQSTVSVPAEEAVSVQPEVL